MSVCICLFKVATIRLFNCMTRPLSLTPLKICIIVALAILILTPMFQVIYEDVQFSRRFNRIKHSYYYYSGRLIAESFDGLFDERTFNVVTTTNVQNHTQATTTLLQKYYDKQFVNNTNNTNLAACPDNPPSLQGKVPVIYPHRVIHLAKNVTKIMNEIAESNPDVKNGGYWYPENCAPQHHVAIIIPYRNRSDHLAMLLQQLHLVLKRQLLHYHIFVVEQVSPEVFNKAFLMNIAYADINSKEDIFDCFIFHDVDLLLENDKNMYHCQTSPKHLSPSVDTLKYQLPYHQLIGGVFAIRPEQFEIVNGYSNLYWGWGGEDDDLYYRLQHENITLHRSSASIGRYKMLRHLHRTEMNPKERFKLVWSAKERYFEDGLMQLPTLNYTIVSITKQKLFTHILVDLGQQPKD